MRLSSEAQMRMFVSRGHIGPATIDIISMSVDLYQLSVRLLASSYTLLSTLKYSLKIFPSPPATTSLPSAESLQLQIPKFSPRDTKPRRAAAAGSANVVAICAVESYVDHLDNGNNLPSTTKTQQASQRLLQHRPLVVHLPTLVFVFVSGRTPPGS